VGTRPEIIRLSRVIARLDSGLDHVLVHTGQNYDFELNEIFFHDLELKKPDHFLNAVGKNPAETIGNVIAKVDAVLETEKPDAFLILGDTNSALSAITAKKRRIPVFHMEAGNRCYDQRVPEEINRKIVDHVSDVNLPYSDIAREYLLGEGFPADRIIKTGSPMWEVLNHYRPKIDESQILSKLGLHKRQYFVVSCHREENVDDDRQLGNLVESLNAVAETYKVPLLFSAHPRTRKRIESGLKFHPNVMLSKPVGFTDYVRLQQDALAVLSDSGTITEESSILNIPALNIRDAHERPEGMEETPALMTGLDPHRILEGLDLVLKQPREHRATRLVADYEVPNVSEKVLRIILSYTPYVNQKVWFKK
jgi:UDP-N-acetyl-L-fucosamine synthase